MSTLIGYLILAAVGVLVVGAIWRPTWALALLLIQYPLEQLLQSYIVFFVQRNELFNVIIGALAIVSLSIKVLTKPRPLQASLNTASMLCLLYYVLAGASVIWSPTQQSAVEILRPGFSYVFIFVVLGPLMLDRIEEVREFFVVTLILSAIVALLVLTNPNGDFVRGRFALRLGGIGLKESNPLAMSDLGAFLVLTAATLNLTRRSTLLLLFRIGGGIVGTGLLIAASSRGQVLAAGLVAALFYPVSVQVKNLGQFFLRVALLGALAVMLLLGARLFQKQAQGTEKRWDTAELSAASEIRVENMRVLLAEWGRRPANWPLGLGTGGFAAFEKTSHEPYVHNMIVESLGEFGLLGFGIFMGILLSTWRSALSLLRMCWNDPDARAIAASLVALNAFQFLVSNKQGSVWVSTQMWTGFLLMMRVQRILASEGGLPEPEHPIVDAEESHDSHEAHGVART